MSGGYENKAADLEDDGSNFGRRNSDKSTLSHRSTANSEMKKKVTDEIILSEFGGAAMESTNPRLMRMNSGDKKSFSFMIAKPIVNARETISEFAIKHAKIVSRVALLIFVILYWIYFGFAVSYEWNRGCCSWCSGVRLLIIITGLTVFGLAYGYAFKPLLGDIVYRRCMKPLNNIWDSYNILRWYVIYLVLLSYENIYKCSISINIEIVMLSASICLLNSNVSKCNFCCYIRITPKIALVILKVLTKHIFTI